MESYKSSKDWYLIAINSFRKVLFNPKTKERKVVELSTTAV
jgi:hypothetical protein